MFGPPHKISNKKLCYTYSGYSACRMTPNAAIMPVKVSQGHWFRYQSRASRPIQHNDTTVNTTNLHHIILQPFLSYRVVLIKLLLLSRGASRWRIQDLQRGKVERHMCQYRGADLFWLYISKCRLLVHSERYFCSSAAHCTSKKHCFWAYKTCCCSLHAQHWQQKAANTSLLESRSLLKTANFYSA